MAARAPQFDGEHSPGQNLVETDDDTSSNSGGSVSTTEEGSPHDRTSSGTADSSSSSSDSSDESARERKCKSESFQVFPKGNKCPQAMCSVFFRPLKKLCGLPSLN